MRDATLTDSARGTTVHKKKIKKRQEKESSGDCSPPDRLGRRDRRPAGGKIFRRRPRYAPAPRTVISTQASVHFENVRITRAHSCIREEPYFSRGLTWRGTSAAGRSARPIARKIPSQFPTDVLPTCARLEPSIRRRGVPKIADSTFERVPRACLVGDFRTRKS